MAAIIKDYTYYLMDWDGNLAKTLDIWLVALRTVAETRGISVTDEQIGASFGDFEPHMASWGITDPHDAMEEASVIARGLLSDVILYPDALRVLEELHARGKRIALITTSPRENVEHLLTKHNVARFFEVTITGDDVVNHKPHAEPLEKALGLLDGIKSEAVMIGDSDKDLGAARNFGIDSILFYPEEHRKFYDLKELIELEPTFVVGDFGEILTNTNS